MNKGPKKAVKLKLYQPFACYRKPFSFSVWDTLPLPPFSTVKGLVHHSAKAQKAYPIWVSVHGTAEGSTYEIQKLKKFDRKREENPKIPGISKSLVSTPAFVELLTEVHLTIYLHFPEESQELKEKFLDGLLKTDFPALGRREDLAVLEEKILIIRWQLYG